MQFDPRDPSALLISAPFGVINSPPLGVSLIKATTQEAGFRCDVWYASLEFAKEIGFPTYSALQGCANAMLLPERPFAKALFPDLPPMDEYFREVVERFGDGIWPFIPAHSLSLVGQAAMEKLEAMALRFIDEVAERPIFDEYDVIGFSSCYGQNVGSLALAKAIKEKHPGKLVVFGGANCEGIMGRQLVRSFDFVDYAFAGDGDLTFPLFMKNLRYGGQIQVPGVSSRDDGIGVTAFDGPAPMRMNMDELPFPDFTEYFETLATMPEGEAYQQAIPIEGSRGCWWGQKHHCTFCGLNGLTMQFRAKSPERFVAEVKHLVERWGQKRVRASDNIMDPSWLRSVVPVLEKEHGYDVMFFEVKANLAKHDVAALANAGITNLLPGIESLSNHVLDLMDKGTSVMQNLQLLKWCSEYGICLTWNILSGFPGETAEDYLEMAELMTLLPHLEAPSGFARISVDRFSPYFQHPERYGIEVETAIAYGHVYDLPEDEIENLAFWHYYVCENGTNRYSVGPPEHARPALRVRTIWEMLAGKVHFRYRVEDDGTVCLEDTRPCSAQEHTRLDPLCSEIFRLTDRARSRRGILRELRASEGFEGVTEEELDAALESLVERKIHYRDGDRYLALATDAAGRERSVPISDPRILTA